MATWSPNDAGLSTFVDTTVAQTACGTANLVHSGSDRDGTEPAFYWSTSGELTRSISVESVQTTLGIPAFRVMPEYRDTDLHAAPISQTIDGVRAAGYTRLEASLTEESDATMRHTVAGAGTPVYRRYRVHQRPIKGVGGLS